MVALATVVLLAGVMPMAHGTGRWYGWASSDCSGKDVVNSSSFEIIYFAIIAGLVKSYALGRSGHCITASPSSG